MATGKKGFVLYCDLKYTFDKLTNDEAGQLIKHLLDYVNDLNPETPNRMIELMFEPIKQQLKRDLKHWETVREGRSKAGKASANKRQQNQQMLTSSTVIDTVTVTVKDKVKVITINEVYAYFQEKGYTKEAAEKFYEYYSVADWKDAKGNKVRNWKQKAQAVWFKPENKQQEIKQQYKAL